MSSPPQPAPPSPSTVSNLTAPWSPSRDSISSRTTQVTNLEERESEESLGPWAVQAFDENGNRQIPRLKAEVFEDYLISNDVHLIPDRDSNATSVWPKLLAALGIRPETEGFNGRKIISWQSMTRISDSVDLEVDAAVLCHLANLFSTSDVNSTRKYDMEKASVTSFNLEFGVLSWITGPGDSRATFEPHEFDWSISNESVRTFGDLGNSLEPGTLWMSYYNALAHGVSKTKYAWPKASDPIEDRVQCLFQNLTASGEYLYCFPSDDDCILVTQDWFEEIWRIRKQVLSNGGTDFSFWLDMDLQLSNLEDKGHRKDSIESIDHYVRLCYNLQNPGPFRIIKQPPDARSHSRLRGTYGEQTILSLALDAVLDGYEKMGEDSWKSQFRRLSRSNVYDIMLMTGHLFIHSKSWILKYSLDSPKWKGEVSIVDYKSYDMAE